MKITKIGPEGLKLIMKYEGFSSKPYVDPGSGGLPITIGYGNTFYEDKTKIKLTDSPITKERGLELLKITLISFEQYVDSFVRDDITQYQFDALCSFVYNLGSNSLKTSTLLKLINSNPNNVAPITQNFNKWVNAGGKILPGLVARRAAEAELFFKQ